MDAKRAAGPTWETVRYMVAAIQYGGRITDELDKGLMATYAERYFHQVWSDSEHGGVGARVVLLGSLQYERASVAETARSVWYTGFIYLSISCLPAPSMLLTMHEAFCSKQAPDACLGRACRACCRPTMSCTGTSRATSPTRCPRAPRSRSSARRAHPTPIPSSDPITSWTCMLLALFPVRHGVLHAHALPDR